MIFILVKSYQGEYIPVTGRIFLGSNVDLFVKYTCQIKLYQYNMNEQGMGYYRCKYEYVKILP